MACVDCGSMTDGGEETYVTREWCRCENRVFDFGYEEPINNDMYCSIHQCEKNLTDYDDGSRYECSECERERGESLGLR